MSKNGPPLDDAGIAIDQMLEVCSFIIKRLHKKSESAASIGEDISTKELRDIAMTMDVVWNLTRDIIDYDISQTIDPEDSL